MKTRVWIAGVLLFFLGISVSEVSAVTIDLYDWGLNIDGAVYVPGDSLPGSVNTAALDFGSGLGTLTISVSGVGSHEVVAFFDHEIDEVDNTFFNEVGDTSGAAAAGQSWEIDEPGYVSGDIYDNFVAGSLDESNASTAPDDVSMAMGWEFELTDPVEVALITFNLTETMPASGFYLAQYDPESEAAIYLTGNLVIRGEGAVPEPATLLLVGTGLAGAAGLKRRLRLKK